MSMSEFPIRYIEPVFRPPSEAHSLILPVTNGCSWNACTFCEMYTAPQKKFRARDEVEVLEEIRRCGEQLIVQRVFLADGDALVLPTRRLLKILEQIRQRGTGPRCRDKELLYGSRKTGAVIMIIRAQMPE